MDRPSSGQARIPELRRRKAYLAALPRLDACGAVPASAATEDWCEVRGLEDGRAALMVGHLPGAGDSTAGAVLAATRERLTAGDLDGAIHLFASAASACLALLDPSSGDLSYGVVGPHPGPVLVAPSGRVTQLPGTGRATVGEDDLLLLFDARSAEPPLVEAVVRSAQHLAAPAARGIEEPFWQVAEELVTLQGRDLVLLAARRTPALQPLEITLPARPGSTWTIRTAARDWLLEQGVSLRDRIVVDTVLRELCRTVVSGASSDRTRRGPMRARLDLSATGVLQTSVVDEGRWLPGPVATSAGLSLARAASDSLDVHVEDTGTRAVATHRVTREGPRVVARRETRRRRAAAG